MCEHTVNAATEPKLEAGPERWPGEGGTLIPTEAYGSDKIPLAVPMLESVCVRAFDRYNRLQILREVPLGVTLAIYEGKGGQ